MGRRGQAYGGFMSHPKKIVIVGGVAGGMSAAARARRLDEEARIIVIERTGYVSFANCGLPYFLGGDISNYDDLILQTPESLAARFRLEVKVSHEVRSIDRAERSISGLNLQTQEPFTFDYDELILSVGAQPIRPPIPGLDREGVFTLRNMEDTAKAQSRRCGRRRLHRDRDGRATPTTRNEDPSH